MATATTRSGAAPGDDNGLSGNAGDNKVYGDEGDDDLSGNAGDDKLFGGPGDDRLKVADEFEPDPTPGHDVLDGGAGDGARSVGVRSRPVGRRRTRHLHRG